MSAGLGILVKPHIALVWPALGLYVLLTLVWPDERFRWPDRQWWQAQGCSAIAGFGIWLAGWLPPVLVQMFYNAVLFGGPFTTGYNVKENGLPFIVPFYIGLFGQTFSSGKGIVFYTPLVVAGLLALHELRRRHRWLSWTIVIALLIHLAVLSRFRFWYGGGSWGPRFTVLILPLLLLPIGPWLAARSNRHLRRGLIAGLAACGLFVQTVGIWINFDTPILMVEDTERHFIPWYSPLVMHSQLAGDRLQLWQDVFRPRPGSAMLMSGFSYEGVNRAPDQGVAPFKALPQMTVRVRPRGDGPIELRLVVEANPTVDLLWDSQPVKSSSVSLSDGAVQVTAILPGGVDGHLLTLLLATPNADTNLRLVSEFQLLEGQRELLLQQHPYIPPMPSSPLRLWQWFHVPNIPHLTDNWLWYLYVSGLPPRQALLIALPLLTLAGLFAGTAVWSLARLHHETRASAKTEGDTQAWTVNSE